MPNYPYDQLGTPLDLDNLGKANGNWAKIATDIASVDSASKQRDTAMTSDYTAKLIAQKNEYTGRLDFQYSDYNGKLDQQKSEYTTGFQIQKTRIDNIVSEISNDAFQSIVDSAKLVWLAPVDVVSDLTISYPEAIEGNASMVRATGVVYRFNGLSWDEIQEIDPTAINEVDSRLSGEIEQKTTFLSTVSAMKTKNLKVGDFVVTKGYYSPNDGGEASYNIVSSGTGTDDGGSFISLNNGLQAQLLETSYNNVKQFGAKGDGIRDDSDSFIANLAWGGRLGNKLCAPQGRYLITKRITVNECHIEGDGLHRTYLLIEGSGQLYATGTGVTIEKLTLVKGDSLGTEKALNALELGGTYHSKFNDLYITGFLKGVKIGSNNWANTFEKVNVMSSDVCFAAEGAEINNTSFYNCHAHNSRVGFYMVSPNDGFQYKLSFVGCQIELCSDTGVYVQANGSYSFDNCYFERNNLTNQTGLDKGGLCVSYPNTFGPRPTTLDLIGCYHLNSNVRLKQTATATTTLISNWFKGVYTHAIEILNPEIAPDNKVLNINPSYESVTSRTNVPNMVYDMLSSKMTGATRPSDATSGQMFVDSAIGKPLWRVGSKWLDADGIVPENIGKNATVNSGVSSILITLPTSEFNNNYSVSVAPSWNTTVWVTEKDNGSFRVSFGTAPTSAKTIDWMIKR